MNTDPTIITSQESPGHGSDNAFPSSMLGSVEAEISSGFEALREQIRALHREGMQAEANELCRLLSEESLKTLLAVDSQLAKARVSPETLPYPPEDPSARGKVARVRVSLSRRLY